MSTTVKLNKPIQAHGATLSELTLREPRGKDIASCGMPRGFSQRGKTLSMDVDTAAVHAYISTLGNIPPSSVDQLDAADWMEVMGAVLDFFAPPPKAKTDDDAPPAPQPPVTAQPAPGTISMPFQDPTT